MDREIRWSAESLRQLKKLGKKRPRLGEDVTSFEDEFAALARAKAQKCTDYNVSRPRPTRPSLTIRLEPLHGL